MALQCCITHQSTCLYASNRCLMQPMCVTSEMLLTFCARDMHRWLWCFMLLPRLATFSAHWVCCTQVSSMARAATPAKSAMQPRLYCIAMEAKAEKPTLFVLQVCMQSFACKQPHAATHLLCKMVISLPASTSVGSICRLIDHLSLLS